MESDKLKTLELLENRLISAAEALEFLEVIDAAPGAAGGVSLRVRVYARGQAEPRANIKVPLAWAKFLAPFIEGKIAGDLASRGYVLDTGKIHDAVQAARPAGLVDVRNGGDRVEIFIE
ncbi:MAG TPA: hypothetical protein DCW72_07680 [Elusimicrobia bacterium]|nr:MAG: hypothetical protein A2X29_05785 [Elusimicrobia bacterium GWA2_64_40]OGR67043.1 MAG: hypothetical protein A2X30_06155 [Elusimicrobia bacterium GWB2_63_16]HAN03856.1 hypothetical protein [Elusimicrobiota bacterium]HAU90092.1 hypothetical protein [Elusimicrobiota bacterium]